MQRTQSKPFRFTTRYKLANNPVSSHFIIYLQESEGEMTTPRNSMVGAFPAEPLKGPIAMHAAQKGVPRRVPVVVGPTQSFFMREAKALGVSQSPCIPHPRDSLASRSSCYRPGTGFNLT